MVSSGKSKIGFDIVHYAIAESLHIVSDVYSEMVHDIDKREAILDMDKIIEKAWRSTFVLTKRCLSTRRVWPFPLGIWPNSRRYKMSH